MVDNKQKFDRTMKEEVYQTYQPYIKQLVNKVKEINKTIDKKIPVLFYNSTELRLYINGLALLIHFYNDHKSKDFKITYAKAITSLIEVYKNRTAIDKFENFLNKLPDIINVFLNYKNNKQKERELEGNLVAVLQNGKHPFAALDMEIVVSNSLDKNCLFDSSSNAEMDMLLIAERNNELQLIPVELKRAEATPKTIKQAPVEIASSINLLLDEEIRKAMIKTYVNNFKKYKELGLLTLNDQKITYEALCSGLIVIIDERKGKLYTIDTVDLKDEKNSKLIDKTKCPEKYNIKRLTMSSEVFLKGKWIEEI